MVVLAGAVIVDMEKTGVGNDKFKGATSSKQRGEPSQQSAGRVNEILLM